jgi:hypothetical protein
MTQTSIDLETLKQALKEALSETLRAERGLLHEVFGEVLEDFGSQYLLYVGQGRLGHSSAHLLAVSPRERLADYSVSNGPGAA